MDSTLPLQLKNLPLSLKNVFFDYKKHFLLFDVANFIYSGVIWCYIL